MEIQFADLPKSVKNDYSLSFWTYRNNEKKRVFFMAYVQSPITCVKWVKYSAKKDWDFIQVYNRRSREYIGRVNLPSTSVYQ